MVPLDSRFAASMTPWSTRSEQIPGSPPDVLLADIGLPGMSGIEGVRRIHEWMPELPILMLTVHEDSDSVFSAVCAGACGYLLKETPPARLLESIRELYEGGAPMSPGIARKVVLMFQKAAPPKEDMQLSVRQLEILRMLAEGHSYKACAASARCRPGHDTFPCPQDLRAAARTLALGGRLESAAGGPSPRQ